MSQTATFSAALAAAEQLDSDSQAELVAVLSRRLAERGREQGWPPSSCRPAASSRRGNAK